MNLNDLSLFAHVVDHGGFAAASRQLNIPKSTLSKRVATLEKTLGVRLIHRTSRSFVLTDIGKDFFQHASAMLIEAEAAEHVVKGRLAEPSGAVRITCSVPAAQISLARLMPEIAARYPRMQLILNATDRFVDIARDGFDIGLRDHFAPLPDSDLVQRRLGFQPNWLVASPAYLEEYGRPEQPQDLAHHHGIVTSMSDPQWRLEHAQTSGQNIVVRPKARLAADESTVLLAAVEGGLGISCLPRQFCVEPVASGTLCRVLPDWTAGGVTTTLLTPYRRGQLPSVRAVVDFLIERLAAEFD